MMAPTYHRLLQNRRILGLIRRWPVDVRRSIDRSIDTYRHDVIGFFYNRIITHLCCPPLRNCVLGLL